MNDSSSVSVDVLVRFQQLCGIQVIAPGKYKITNYVKYYYFKLSSTVGEEMFSLLPFLIWLVPLQISSAFFLNFGIVLTCGQLVKDWVKYPRPESDKIAKLEKHFETEYGFPSTHAMSGAIPLSLLWSFIRYSRNFHDVSRHESFMKADFLLWIAAGLVVWISVSLSRLYMGVHAVIDIIGGSIIAFFLMGVLHAVGDDIGILLHDSTFSVSILLCLNLLFIFFYPKSTPWSASYGTTAQIFGAWNGFETALYYGKTYAQDLLLSIEAGQSQMYASEWKSPQMYRVFTRVLIGLIAIGITKVLTKICASIVFTSISRVLYSSHKLVVIDRLGNKVPESKFYSIEVPVRLINYGSLCWMALIGTPIIWRRLDMN